MSKIAEILSLIGKGIGKPPGWERVVQLLAPPSKCESMPELCLVRDGCAFLARPSVQLDWRVALFGTYEPELRRVIEAVLSEGGVAVDVGANVGWHTLLMARRVGLQGRVLAAEANASVRARLEQNLGLNSFTQVEILPYAIADTEGTVDFLGPDAYDVDSGTGRMVAVQEGTQPGATRVETRSLDAIVAARRIDKLDLIKIDVEGFEWPVLLGAKDTIAKFRPHVLFEFDDAYVSRGGGGPTVMAEFFAEHRYRLFVIERAWSSEVKPGNWPQCANIWAVPLGDPR